MKNNVYLRRCFLADNPNEKLNILVIGCTHERYEEQLCKTGHNFYSIKGNKSWDTNYAKVPSNYYQIEYVPFNIKPDLILTHVSGSALNEARNYADYFGVKLIRHTHTMPESNDELNYFQMQNNLVDLNTFISEYSKFQWGVDGEVINHGLDTDYWTDKKVERKNTILSVVNYWASRDWACGWTTYNNIRKNYNGNFKVIGNNPGLSMPSRNTLELINNYNECGVFLNTSQYSPVPMSLLEAMACGSPVVTSGTCMIPEIIKHGENGLIAKSDSEYPELIDSILRDKSLAEKLGQNARKTITEKFNITSFINNWNKAFKELIS